MRALYKITVVAWAEADPFDRADFALFGDGLERLARESRVMRLAEGSHDGEVYISLAMSLKIENPEQDEDWDGTKFFTR